MTKRLATLKDYRVWLRLILAAAIQDGCRAAVAIASLAGASAMGVPIQALDWKQAAGVFASAAVITVLRKLSEKPLPDGTESDETPEPNPPQPQP